MDGSIRIWALSLLMTLFAALAALAAATGAMAAQPEGEAIFGSQEVRSDKLALFPKWTTTLERYANERAQETAACDEGSPDRCRLHRWRGYVESLRGRDRLEILRSVNRFANTHRYVTDPVNSHLPDYWATPLEFLAKNGDCEDYAITKYLSLKTLGFTDADMRIVVLQDLNLRAAHAVLVVFERGKAWLLDNQVREVVPTEAVHHYRAIFSINQTAWWLHRY
jgi:predicted transglutaminase-like cysteine proteinase